MIPGKEVEIPLGSVDLEDDTYLYFEMTILKVSDSLLVLYDTIVEYVMINFVNSSTKYSIIKKYKILKIFFLSHFIELILIKIIYLLLLMLK